MLCDCNKFKEAEPLIFDLENFSDTEEQKEDADETASDFYAITENPRGAIKYLEYILPKRERKAPIFLKIAEAHFDMGNSPMAEENINLAISEEPSNSEVRMNASLLYLNADFIDKSVEQINYITQNDSNYSGLTKQVIAKTFLLSSNHWRDGIDLIKECLEENPNDLDSLYLLIRIYCKYGMYNDAIKQIEFISNYQSIDDETVTKYNYLIGSIMSMFRKIKEHTVTTTNDDLSVESEIKIEEIFNILENGINDILKNYKMNTISFDEFEDIKNDIEMIFEDNAEIGRESGRDRV